MGAVEYVSLECDGTDLNVLCLGATTPRTGTVDEVRAYQAGIGWTYQHPGIDRCPKCSTPAPTHPTTENQET